MSNTILETRPGTVHTHINEVGGFTVTRLVSEVVYTLEQSKYFTDWIVTGKDAAGVSHRFDITRAGLSGESRFSGIL